MSEIAFRVTGFAGVVSRRGARLLDPNQAQTAVNCRLTSGYIVPLKQPKLILSPGVLAVQAIFRMTDGLTDTWLAVPADADFVKGPIAGDTTFRTYFTGYNEPRVTNLALAGISSPHPGSFFVLGVFPPQTAPGVSHGGGVGAAISRAFVYTFVTPWGEESAPSPSSAVVTGKVDGTWTINSMDTAPPNSFVVTGGSWALGVATLNVASTFGLRVGEEVSVTSVNPTGYNGRFVLTAVAAGSVSFALAVNPGAYIAGGAIARVAPHNTAGMTKNVYWTETTVSGTTFRLVAAGIPVATVSTTVAGNAASSEELPSLDWPMPPTDMKGLVLHPSGSTIGFSKNTLYFSPPYINYAYPVALQLTTDYDIVGISVVGSMVIVGTKGTPYVAAGITPDSMELEKVDQPWPCLSKRGMVNLGFGVAYPAPQGLALIGPGVSDLITRDLYTQEEWKDLLPASFVAAQYAGRYIASYVAGSNNRQVLIIDKSEFASAVTANAIVQAFWGDPTTGKLYAVISDSIYEWDGDAGLKMMSDWLSREFVFVKPVNLGVAKIDAEFTMTEDEVAAASAASEALRALNAALIAAGATKGSLNSHSLNTRSLNGSAVKTLPPVTWDALTFSLYVDGNLKVSRTVKSGKPFRLPAGYKSDNAAVRVSGNVTVRAINVAETMQGLKQE